jgi:hypothetical protein
MAPITLASEVGSNELLTLLTRELVPRDGAYDKLPTVVIVLLGVVAVILLLGGFKLYTDSKRSERSLAA